MSVIKSFFLVWLLFLCEISKVQGQGDTWCFGDSSIVHFANGQASALPFCSMISYEASSSISDKNGNLLFYSGGYDQNSLLIKVLSSNHQIMQNGDSLYGFASSTNGTLIIPFVSDTSKYYLFHHSFILGPTFYLYYSIIDMSLNSGLGAVTQKNILLNSNNMAEKLAAVKHGNGRDWWLVAHQRAGTNYYIYLIDSNGIHLPIIQPIGKNYTVQPEAGFIGEIAFSPDGQKMVAVSNQMIDYFEFDRCSGNLFNYQDLAPTVPTTDDLFYGTSFSSQRSRLYVSSLSSLARSNPSRADLYQFDLNASNIKQSRLTLYSIFNSYKTFGQHQLGPDGKIYISIGSDLGPVTYFDSTNMFLNTIENPDSLGFGCNFQRYSLYLNGHRTFLGLPNIPNYNLGALVGSPCDTITGLNENNTSSISISISPNPATDFFWISYDLSNQPGNAELIIYNTLGEIVQRKALYHYFKTSKIDCSGFADGVYYLAVTSNGQRMASGKFMKE